MNGIQFDTTPVFLVLAGTLFFYSACYLVAYWRLFVRANRPGWAALVPIYSTYITGQIAKKPTLALLENVFSTSFLAAILISFLSNSVDIQGFSLLIAFIISLPLLLVDIKLEKYFLKQFTPSKLVEQLKLNLNPLSTLSKLGAVKYKGKK